jgi:hypothetical protein
VWLPRADEAAPGAVPAWRKAQWSAMPCADPPAEFDVTAAESVCLACMAEPLRGPAERLLADGPCSFCGSVSDSDETPSRCRSRTS